MHGVWSRDVVADSSCWLELLAVLTSAAEFSMDDSTYYTASDTFKIPQQLEATYKQNAYEHVYSHKAV